VIPSPTPDPRIRTVCAIAMACMAAGACLAQPALTGETEGGMLQINSVRYGGLEFAVQPGKSTEPPSRRAGDEARVIRYDTLRFSREGGPLQISFGPPKGAERFAERVQYKLEGHDSDWNDIDKGSMHLVLKFLDEARVPVSRAEFKVGGNSAQWGGRLEDSGLSQRVEETTVPPRAALASVWIDSGGHDENAGVWLVDELKISDVPVPPGAETVILDDDFEEGEDLGLPQGNFALWVRDGGALGGAMVHHGPPATGRHALLVVDSDPLDYSAWRLKDRFLLPVIAGHRLRLQWREVYSIGRGRGGEAVYSGLPYGQYQFRLRAVDALGKPAGEELVLPLVVTPPLHANVWFRAAVLASLFVLILAVERLVSRGRTRRKFERLEHKRAIEEERARIARDIHDDLGTVLSRISMASESASLEAMTGTAQQKRLDEICQASRDLTRTMEQIVWAQNPVHDTIDNTAAYFASFATDLLNAAGIVCRLDIPIDLPHAPLEADKRHALFLVFKEALNNIIKHAQATNVWIKLRIDGRRILLSIRDDGRGFDPHAAESSRGNGLPNMKTRLERAGGEVKIISSPGQGTRTEILFPLGAASPGTARP